MYFAYADGHLYAFSMPGKKIDIMRANPRVSVAVEQRGQGREWKSVVADGRFEELADRIGTKRAREHAWTVLSTHVEWWVPGALKPATMPLPSPRGHVFFRILIDAMSGREAVDAQ
jgi:nitroimidazol reductase NimA-like FMN-containing flavoprotein (pyridoxamine 5'-phosphate oxidase superfamily)